MSIEHALHKSSFEERGEAKSLLFRPKSGVSPKQKRAYIERIYGSMSNAELERYIEGFEIPGHFTGADRRAIRGAFAYVKRFHRSRSTSDSKKPKKSKQSEPKAESKPEPKAKSEPNTENFENFEESSQPLRLRAKTERLPSYRRKLNIRFGGIKRKPRYTRHMRKRINRMQRF